MRCKLKNINLLSTKKEIDSVMHLNNVVWSFKFKYSSLLSLKKKNSSVLYLKGPLGINYLKIPYRVKFLVDDYRKVILFYCKKSILKRGFTQYKIKTKQSITSIVSIFNDSCRTLVFGDLIGLDIQGLGLKFLKINNLSNNKQCLSMSLGYSDLTNYSIDSNRSFAFFKDTRTIYIYSTDYSYLRNQIFRIISFKKPNKFYKRPNGISLLSIVI